MALLPGLVALAFFGAEVHGRLGRVLRFAPDLDQHEGEGPRVPPEDDAVVPLEGRVVLGVGEVLGPLRAVLQQRVRLRVRERHPEHGPPAAVLGAEAVAVGVDLEVDHLPLLHRHLLPADLRHVLRVEVDESVVLVCLLMLDLPERLDPAHVAAPLCHEARAAEALADLHARGLLGGVGGGIGGNLRLKLGQQRRCVGHDGDRRCCVGHLGDRRRCVGHHGAAPGIQMCPPRPRSERASSP
mmetsp:Transcript_11204/g.33128  ORF Transcript_11204/g.33128 Transcript_11204/m.33128 type:complete len:241 (+) Transcript_11204:353-1075(+)